MADDGSVGSAAAAQGGSVVGGLIGLGVGAGQNTKPVNSFFNPGGWTQSGYNPNATNYNGSPTGLSDYTSGMNQQAANADNRQAPTADYTDANTQAAYGNADRSSQLSTLQNANDIAAAQKARALGQVPSIAEQVGQRQTQQAIAAQGSQQASARGAAGVALAGQGAANNVANATSAISNQTQINAANERAAAEAAAANTYGNIAGLQGGVRQTDIGAQGQSAAQAQFQAQQQLASRTANDQRALGSQTLAANAQGQQLAAKTSEQGSLAQSYGLANQQTQTQAQNNANNSGSWWSKILSDENAKTLLTPLTQIQNPASGPVGAFGQVQDQDMHSGDFKDPGPNNVMGELKADSDYATRFTKDPGSTAFYSDTRAKEAAVFAKGHAAGLALGKGGANAIDQQDVNYIKNGYDQRQHPTEEMLDDRAKQNEVGPDTIGKVALDRAIGSQAARDQRLAGVRSEMAAEPQAYQGLYGGFDKSGQANASPSMGALAAAGRSADQGNQPIPAPTQSPATPWWATSQPGTMLSDDRTKLSEAYTLGRAHQMEYTQTGQRPGGWEYQPGEDVKDVSINPEKREHEMGIRQPISFVRDTAPRQTSTQGPNLKSAAKAGYESMMLGAPAMMAAQAVRDYDTSQPMADAARSMAGQPYSYKPGFTPPGQQPGEVNIGPMAQNMEKSPVAATAIKTDPGTGLKTIDKDKAMKVQMSIAADHQKQLDELHGLIAGGRAQ